MSARTLPTRDLLLLALLALLPLLAACEGTTEPPRDSPAAAFVNVNLLTPSRADTIGNAAVFANVMPGRDARGVVREVSTPLRVGGRALALASSGDPSGARFVNATTVRPSSALGAPLTIEAPAVAGLTPNRPRVRVTTVRALDPDTVRVGADGAVRLHLALAPGGDAATMRQWTMTIAGAQGLTYRGTGQPPTELVVPRDLLPAPTPAGQWRAQLDVQEGHGVEYGAPTTLVTVPPYDVRVLYQQLVQWVVVR